MASIAQQQDAIAAAITALGTFSVRLEPPAQAKAGDGWVNVGRVVPGSTMTTCDCTFVVVLIVGADARQASRQIRTLPVQLVNAVTASPTLHPDGVTVEPATLPAGDVAPGELYALVLTLTLEVDS